MRTINDTLIDRYRINKNQEKMFELKGKEIIEFYDDKIKNSDSDAKIKYYKKMKKMALHMAEKNSYAKHEIQSEIINLYSKINFLSIVDAMKDLEDKYNQMEYGCYLK